MAEAAVQPLHVELEGDFAGLWADMNPDPDWGMIEGLQDGSFEKIGTSLAALTFRWNFTDRLGKPAPISLDGLRRLKARQVTALLRGYNGAFSGLPNELGGA